MDMAGMKCPCNGRRECEDVAGFQFVWCKKYKRLVLWRLGVFQRRHIEGIKKAPIREVVGMN